MNMPTDSERIATLDREIENKRAVLARLNKIISDRESQKNQATRRLDEAQILRQKLDDLIAEFCRYQEH